MRQRLPPRDRQQPRLDARLAAKAADAPKRPQEHVLRDVFGVIARPEDRAHRAHDDVLVAIDQDAQTPRGRRPWRARPAPRRSLGV